MAEILSEFGHLVGLAGGNNIQATTMPTYSSVPLGTIVQYIGTTTADYINGYFYKATATGWEQHDTQPASNADNSITAFKESSPALSAHAVDEYIRYNNVTYIVTTAIAIGDTLTIGTNIAVPTLDEGTVIYTPEAGGGSVISADMVGYDNTTSELEATNTQDAIDEVVDIVADKVDKVMGKGLSTNDYDNTDKAKVGKIDETTTSVTGNPISISGLKSNQLAKDPIITFEPIQAGSGDPSPSNVRAISGYDKIEVLSTGKNLDSAVNEISANVTVTNTDTGYHLQSTSSIMWSNYKRIYKLPKNLDFTISSDITIVSGHATIIISGSNSSQDPEPTSIKTVNFDSGGKKEVSFNSGNYEYIYIAMFDTWDSAVSGDVTYSEFMIRDARISDSTYEPYHKTTDLSLTLGQTIYGGTLDVETGVLTVDTGYDSYKWSDGESVVEYTYCIVKRYDLSNRTVINPSTGAGDESITNIAIYDHNFYHDTPHYYIQNGYDLVVFLSKEASADTDIQVAYKLETPYTIQLTPHEISLLKDHAYVSTNGTNMSFSYKNGELASLSDVAQLGETVNELGDAITNAIDHGNYFTIGKMVYIKYRDNIDFDGVNAAICIDNLPMPYGYIPGYVWLVNINNGYTTAYASVYFDTDANHPGRYVIKAIAFRDGQLITGLYTVPLVGLSYPIKQ